MAIGGRGALGGLLVLAVAGGGWASAAVVTAGSGAGVDAATTGNFSELETKVPITKRRAAERRVVMSLGPRRLRRFERGDRITATAEVQVTTTCAIPTETRCIGRPYEYSPAIGARLVLADSRRVTGGPRAIPLGRRKTVTCKQRRPNRNHHCMLVFSRARRTISRLRELPCDPGSCAVNAVVYAHHRRAQPGNVILIGADLPDGTVKRDKSRLNAIIARTGEEPRPGRRETERELRRYLPVDGQRAIYSVKLPRLAAGDVLLARARQVIGIGALPYNTWTAAELILATSPTAIHPGPLARRSARLEGRLTEVNGFNCTHGPSAYESPCVTRKVGQLTMRRRPIGRRGQPKPLYLNLLVRLAPKLADRRAGDRGRVKQGGGLTVTRFR